VAAIGRRLALASEIGREKRRLGRTPRDWARNTRILAALGN